MRKESADDDGNVRAGREPCAVGSLSPLDEDRAGVRGPGLVPLSPLDGERVGVRGDCGYDMASFISRIKDSRTPRLQCQTAPAKAYAMVNQNM